MAGLYSPIVDQRGEPIRRSERQVRPEVDMEYAGIGMGRDITRGYVGELHYLYPQDKVLRFQGAHNYELYEDLLQDDRVYSTFAQRRSAVVAREWAVEPGGERARTRWRPSTSRRCCTASGGTPSPT